MKKVHSVGMEAEFFLINADGALVNGVSELHKKFGVKKPFMREVSDSMLEFTTVPHSRSIGSVKSLVSRLARVEKFLVDRNLFLLPAGTYPGKSSPHRNRNKWYDNKAAIIGKKFDYFAPRVCGFHFHFCLPKAALLPGRNKLRVYNRHDSRHLVLSQYNFLLAADPSISCFLQSSPFFEGEFWGKDSRILAYRTMDNPKGKGLYSGFEEFGGTPPYAHTITEINRRVEERREKWLGLTKKSLGAVPKKLRNASHLDFFWGPVRINKVGTLEHRGMDSNIPTLLLAASSTLRAVLKKIFYGEIIVKPHSKAIEEPFLLDGKTLFVPPHEYLTDVLQPVSALYGFDSSEITKYCEAFFSLSERFQSDAGKSFAEPFAKILRDRHNVADGMIDFAKKKGFRKGEPLGGELARMLALKRALNFNKELDRLGVLEREFPA